MNTVKNKSQRSARFTCTEDAASFKISTCASKPCTPYFSPQHGSAMIELIVVLALAGIVCGIAISSGRFDANPISETDIIKNHLRYAQVMALANDDDEYSWRIVFDANPPNSSYPAGSYWYYLAKIKKSDNTVVAKLKLPNEDAYDHILGIKIIPDAVTFNEWGMTVDNTTSATPLTVNKEIKLDNATTTTIITITKNTGFIQ